MPSSPIWNDQSWVDFDVAQRVDSCACDVDAAFDMAQEFSPVGRMMGRTSWPVLSALATLGCSNLTLARAMEPHLDAMGIITQSRSTEAPAPEYADDTAWGVYAASPPGTQVTAEPRAGSATWTLTGSKPWCSLADRVSHALITASVPDRGQQLFAVEMRQPSVQPQMSHWKAHGLPTITTGTVHLRGAIAHPVGPVGWYLDRPGFAWGGIGVAAIWFGAAAAVASALWTAAAARAPDQIALMHIGSCDVLLHGALLSLRSAAATMDDEGVTSQDATVLAARTRSCVAEAAERILTTVGHALGPGPLAYDEPHLQRVADLTLYLRQHHAERDHARLGELVAP